MKVKNGEHDPSSVSKKKGLFRGVGKTDGRRKDGKKSRFFGLNGSPDSSDVRNDDQEADPRSEAGRQVKIKTMLMENETESLADKLTTLFSEKRQMAAVYTSFGSDPHSCIEVVSEDEIPAPLSSTHVVIKIQASSVTLGDCILRRGFSFELFNPTGLPSTPGHDVVGTIVTCGSGIKDFKVGDRVAALIRTGGNARYASVPESSLVKVPLHIDSAEAAAVVTVYMTAYQALRAVSGEGPLFSADGKKILVVGGMDSVAHALIQLCLKAKADVYATGPSRRHSYMRNVLGVTPLPEESAAWLPCVENEIDIVFDGLCEDGLVTPLKALNESGKLVCFGHAAMLKEKDIGAFGAPMSAHLNRFWGKTKSRTVTFDLWESYIRDPETYKKNLKSLFQLVKWDKVRPTIARRVSLSEVAKAHEKLEEGSVRGVIVCIPWKRVAPKSLSPRKEEVRES